MVAVNKLQSMQRTDLLVKVDVSRFSSIDYTEYDELIEKGYQAAEQYAKLLNPFRSMMQPGSAIAPSATQGVFAACLHAICGS